jgi:NADPH-dependent 2,4-dienoyl-CoA reductase/sulfur reductase-like enzyme
MTQTVQTLIVGAGPAGMSAAVRLRQYGMQVMVIDEQPAPGGQIWRAVETAGKGPAAAVLGPDYQSGAALAARFRASGAEYRPQASVWQIEDGWHVYMTRDGKAEVVQAAQVLLAIGAQERPAPFPGWTLPGVMTVGAAQILLKTSNEVPAEPVWIAGSGPLVLLYMTQLLRAGGRIAGWLDTTPAGAWRRALPHAGQALAGWRDLRKGLRWMRELRHAGVLHVRGVQSLRGLGTDHLEAIEYATAGASGQRVPATLLLVHEGVVPSIHMTRAIDCRHAWDAAQSCFVPQVDEWNQSSQPGLFVAGDGAGIGGAKAACLRGELAAIGMALQAGRLDPASARGDAAPLRAALRRELALRPLLDAMYPPRADTRRPADETIVCRCEELTAGEIRRAATIGRPGPNQIKSLTRAGMGPCQGRQCGYTVAHILADVQSRPVAEVGFYRVRPPLKPLTLGELAALDIEENT